MNGTGTSCRGKNYVGLWIFFTVTAVLGVVGLIGWGTAKYVSSGVVQVGPSSVGPSLLLPRDVSSDHCLGRALDSLGSSADAWGGDRASQMTTLQSHLKVTPISGADLFEVSIWGRDPRMAKDSATAVIESLRLMAEERNRKAAEACLAGLDRVIREQEVRVEEASGEMKRQEKLATQAGADANATERLMYERSLVDARDELDAQTKLLRSMQLKRTSERLNLQLPRAVVQVHEEPSTGRREYFWQH